jgi:serine/threonine protein kinase
MPKKDYYNLVGTSFKGRYSLTEFVDEGGMGLVYRAIDQESGRNVAVKLLHPKFQTGEKEASYFLELFQRETEILSNLRHPNIIEIFDSGFENEKTYFVMEWLDGKSLGNRIIEAAPLSFDEIEIILEQLCGALSVAHFHKIVHLDLKPNNIFLLGLEDGNFKLKLIDFGLSRIIQSTMGSTLSRFLGTPQYVAPEIFRNSASTFSDIYSLGIVTYEMLTGVLPFSNTQIWALMQDHMSKEPPSTRSFREDVTPMMHELVNRALDKNPRKRPYAAEFLREFSQSRKTNADRPLSQAPRVAVNGISHRKPMFEPYELSGIMVSAALSIAPFICVYGAISPITINGYPLPGWLCLIASLLVLGVSILHLAHYIDQEREMIQTIKLYLIAPSVIILFAPLAIVLAVIGVVFTIAATILALIFWAFSFRRKMPT